MNIGDFITSVNCDKFMQGDSFWVNNVEFQVKTKRKEHNRKPRVDNFDRNRRKCWRCRRLMVYLGYVREDELYDSNTNAIYRWVCPECGAIFETCEYNLNGTDFIARFGNNEEFKELCEELKKADGIEGGGR